LLTERAQFLVECLDLPAASEYDGAKWEDFQIAHLNCESILRIENKARQIAWSFTVAAEAVASVALEKTSTIFVSINKEEAGEKIRYAKRVHENLSVSGLPKLTGDNVFGLEFDNGTRILSLPSRPPRGKAKMHVVLDEFGHVMFDRAIYRGAMPIIAKGGRLRVGSSPMGAIGTFWEVFTEELKEYPGYVRVTTPWWKVQAFTKDRILPQDAHLLPTAERVEKYGNERIKILFNNMLLEDFQQEHECIFVDEAVSFYTWELIRRNQDADLKCWHIKDVDDVSAVLLEMKAAIAAGQIESSLVGGMDVGRKRNLTEMMFLGVGNVLPVRLMVSLDQTEFKAQEACTRKLLQILPVSTFLIDQNGIGMQLAENLESDTVAEGVTFTNQAKGEWATKLKTRLEDVSLPLPNDRKLAYQIHSIKRKVTTSKNNVYDTEKNEKHHADKMWALALASWAAKEAGNVVTWGSAPQWVRR
jgi:phage FluMu gp28-like protein